MLLTKEELLEKICIVLGGRISEEFLFEQVPKIT